jgi:hypothetical protein
VRVHNLTDVPTQALKWAGLVCVALRVGDTIVRPGESEVVPALGTGADRYIRVGALHVGDDPPKGYTPIKRVEAPRRVTLEVDSHAAVSNGATVVLTGVSDSDVNMPDAHLETKAERKRRIRAEKQIESGDSEER